MKSPQGIEILGCVMLIRSKLDNKKRQGEFFPVFFWSSHFQREIQNMFLFQNFIMNITPAAIAI